ncbi:unnamed protein product [Onchocerca flexuosa]|uniref:Ovule protein n=1 Tax=Onchocerca flexuosa TaxID=387005 RepID=A0A183HK83_9BILA|nr:unnamed protein product [Onchocerca flexuosa]
MMNKSKLFYLDTSNRNLQPIQFIDGTADLNNYANLPEDSRVFSPLHPSFPISSIKDLTPTVPHASTNHQQSIVPFSYDTNQKPNSLVAQPEQFPTMKQQAQQAPQQFPMAERIQHSPKQPLMSQQQPETSAFLPSQENSQISQHQPHFLQPEPQQMQSILSKPMLPKLSQFPTFPSFDQPAFSLS